MNSYWTGVLSGIACSLIFSCIAGYCALSKIASLEENMVEISKECADTRMMVEEHQKIMKAYEFYNWQFERRN